jgi:hypothetical protein
MENLPNPKQIKEQVNEFEDVLFKLKKFLESARREGLLVWQLDIREIEILVPDFERELLVLSDIQHQLEAKQPEVEALRARGMEFLERSKKLEIHNQADFEEAQRHLAEIATHEELIEAKFAPLIEASEQTCYRLQILKEKLLALCRLDTQGSA